MTVEEVVKRIDELNGRTVTVAGYLAECAGYGCVLYVDDNQAKAAEDWWRKTHAAMRRGERPNDNMPGPLYGRFSLGIGAGELVCPGENKHDPNCYFAFDRKAAPFRHSYVMITGKVTNRCRHKGEFGCTDRATDLEPTSIQSWKRSANV